MKDALLNFEDIKYREGIEWSNTWYENAATYDCKRVLFIGDSVTRQYRTLFSNCLEDVCVDFFGSSSIFLMPLFYRQLQSFFEYKYDLIYIHTGALHGHFIQTARSSAEYSKYKGEFLCFINYLKKKCANIYLINFSPVVCESNLWQFDPYFEVENTKRNQILLEISKENGLPLTDLCALIRNDFKKFGYTDKFHFSRKFDPYVVELIIKDTLNSGILSDDLKILYQKGLPRAQEHTQKQKSSKFKLSDCFKKIFK